MFSRLNQYLNKRSDITVDEINTIRAVCIEKKLRKKQYLLQAGDVCHHNCFIVKGCMRLYRVSEDGTEHILRFGVENWWMSDQESYRTENPSKNNIDALEYCEVILIDKQDFNQLKADIPHFGYFIEKLKARSYDASQNRILSHISDTTEVKYQNFITAFPDIFNRVPLHMIASYLGVSRETLSRIRKNIR